MVLLRTGRIIVFGALLAAIPAFATRTHRAATSGHALHNKAAKKHKFTPGQRQIEPERAKEIQDALIRDAAAGPPPTASVSAEAGRADSGHATPGTLAATTSNQN